LRKKYPYIQCKSGILEFCKTEKKLFNNLGLNYTSSYNYYYLHLELYSKKAKNRSNTVFFDHAFRSITEVQKILREFYYNRILNEINTLHKPIKHTNPNFSAVILSPNIVGLIVYNLIDYLSDSAILSGTSIFKDSLNKKISSEKITLRANPKSTNFAYCEHFTSDACLLENGIIIEKGLLKEFVLTDYAARKSGFDESRSRGLMLSIDSGEETLEDIIAKSHNTVLVETLNGIHFAKNGDFSALITNGYYIENGKTKKPN
jgi:PmbA protein